VHQVGVQPMLKYECRWVCYFDEFL